jgi:dTMP kinase
MFITFEGIDGAGKTTQAKLLFEHLNKNGKKAILTKEPGGGGEFCMKIRELLIHYKTNQLTDLFAIYAARNEHIQNTIIPALQEGKIVICDRFLDSTIAYFCYNKQGEDLKNALDFLNVMQTYTADSLKPEKTFLIDANYSVIRERLAERSEGVDDKYDNFSEEKYGQIMGLYYKIQENEPQRMVKIDGNKNKESIFEEILAFVG